MMVLVKKARAMVFAQTPQWKYSENTVHKTNFIGKMSQRNIKIEWDGRK